MSCDVNQNDSKQTSRLTSMATKRMQSEMTSLSNKWIDNQLSLVNCKHMSLTDRTQDSSHSIWPGIENNCVVDKKLLRKLVSLLIVNNIYFKCQSTLYLRGGYIRNNIQVLRPPESLNWQRSLYKVLGLRGRRTYKSIE